MHRELEKEYKNLIKVTFSNFLYKAETLLYSAIMYFFNKRISCLIKRKGRRSFYESLS